MALHPDLMVAASPGSAARCLVLFSSTEARCRTREVAVDLPLVLGDLGWPYGGRLIVLILLVGASSRGACREMGRSHPVWAVVPFLDKRPTRLGALDLCGFGVTNDACWRRAERNWDVAGICT